MYMRIFSYVYAVQVAHFFSKLVVISYFVICALSFPFLLSASSSFIVITTTINIIFLRFSLLCHATLCIIFCTQRNTNLHLPRPLYYFTQKNVRLSHSFSLAPFSLSLFSQSYEAAVVIIIVSSSD